MKTRITPPQIICSLIGIGLIWLLFSYFHFKPDQENDFSTITGIFESAEEQISHTPRGTASGFLEIKLLGDPLRYCVPSDGYLDLFRRTAFFAEVKKGTTIQLSALTSEIEQPTTALLNSKPTIFVRGVSSKGQVYCSLAEYIAWQKSNNSAKLNLIVCGLILIAFVLLPRKINKWFGHETA